MAVFYLYITTYEPKVLLPKHSHSQKGAWGLLVHFLETQQACVQRKDKIICENYSAGWVKQDKGQEKEGEKSAGSRISFSVDHGMIEPGSRWKVEPKQWNKVKIVSWKQEVKGEMGTVGQ